MPIGERIPFPAISETGAITLIRIERITIGFGTNQDYRG